MKVPPNGWDIQRLNFEVARLLDANEPRLTVGASLLGLVTVGISDDPLVMYREYIQNSVDALAANGQSSRGRVEVLIDRQNRQVRIRDNGPGLSYQGCVENLLPIGRSKKTVGLDRGFRGIGRLSGLAFASSVTFLTRSKSTDPVTRVVWPGIAFQEWTASQTIADEAVQESVTVDSLCGSNYPDHFFEVQVDGVGRLAAGLLLNSEAVRAYIGEVCPVPMAQPFPFGEDVRKLFDPNNAPYVQEVVVGDDPDLVKRPYGSDIPFARDRRDRFVEFEPIRIPRMESGGNAAIGWVAHSSYLGAIPKGNRIRGIRARVGNIQIGDERVFDHLFQDDRFNRWCVGEVHVVDDRIAPNARRDYFEPGPYLRHLENHLAPALRDISNRCRSASSARNRRSKILAELSQLEEMCDLLMSGYLSEVGFKDVAKQLHAKSSVISANLRSVDIDSQQLGRLDQIAAKLEGANPGRTISSLVDLSHSELKMYQDMFRAVIDVAPSPAVAKDVIDAVLAAKEDPNQALRDRDGRGPTDESGIAFDKIPDVEPNTAIGTGAPDTER